MKADLSPAGRALRALELLQDQPGITGGQLAAQLGVTERAARRYIAILREAGIPVESTRGPYGGYRAGRGIRLPPLVFTATEALGLVMAVLDGSHAAADADDPVGAALGKIIRVLPENVGRQAAVVRRYACAAPDRGAVRPGTQTTSALVDAIAAQRRVSIGYRSQSGRQWVEDVDPWAVVVRHGRWYLLCHSHRADAVRAFRIDRIQSVAGGGEQFRAPADLDYVDLLEQYLGAGWEFQAKVVFDAPCDEVARYVRPPMGRLNRTDDGARCVLTGTTSNPAMYAGEWLAAIPITFHVEGGPELRAAVADVTARLTAALEPCRNHPGRSRTSAAARRRVSFSFEPGHSRPGRSCYALALRPRRVTPGGSPRSGRRMCMMVSVSDEVALRPVREDDLALLEDLTQNPEKTGEFEWFGWSDLRHWRRGWEEDGLIGPDGGALIVTCGDQRLGLVNWRRQPITVPSSYCWEIGIVLLPEARGRGYGTQAQRLLARYLFAHTTVHRIWAGTEVDNIAEQRALEKAGFTREGITRATGWRDGAWRDGVIYSVLRTDPAV